ncbi:MAG: polyprenol monophosphomannose synthase [Candidatus Omnitrophica bacterium]|nr:polyprenol monophosphomannose synthase [Candidatus Omnitrophota bacterium]
MLSIIIPTYNESENLDDFIRDVAKSLDKVDHEIIIVDDGSPDGTGKIAESLKNRYKNIKVLHRLRKRGLASAVMDGIKESGGDIVATLNADFQHPAEYLSVFYDYLNKYDVVIGSRYVDKAVLLNWPKKRMFLSKFAIFITHLFLPNLKKIRDPLSGYFVLRKKIIEDMHIEPFGPKCLPAILIKCASKRIIELPYVCKGRIKGRSKISIRNGILFIAYIFKLNMQ